MATFKIKKTDGSWEYIGSSSVKVDTTLTQAGMAADAKAVGDAINSYTETDPTVPDWAKAATKPTYTAAEVGITTTTSVTSGSSALVTSGGVYTALSNVKVDTSSLVQKSGDTMEGILVADEISSAGLTTAQVRNIVSVDIDPGAGTASAYPNGTVVLVRE